MNISKYILPAAFVLVMFLTVFAVIQAAQGYLTTQQETPANAYVEKYFFATTTSMTWYATTTSATSTWITAYNDANGRIDNGALDIRGAKGVTWYFSRGGATGPNTGSTKFEVEVSPDGTNWYDYNKLIQATSTTVQTTATISAATSTVRFTMDLTGESYMWARCIIIEATDGDHGCSATVTY